MLRCKNSVEESHYDILSVKEDASYEEIRTSYKLAILNYHPDKLQSTYQKCDNQNKLQDRFLKVQNAWEILGNARSRAVYDKELRALRKDTGVGVAAEDLSLEDMMIEDGGEVVELFYQCRCGDYFSVDSSELEKMGYTLLRDENKEGHSIHIGGLIRLDIEELSADSVYVTVWASPYLPLHMGKTENANTMLEDHFGRQLQPPIGEKRVQELGKWVRKEFHISGSTWDSSSVDIAAAGLGWYAIGLKGEAVVGAWTYEGVDVVACNSLIPFRSQIFEIAGFTVSKIVSKADQALNKLKRQSENKRKRSDHQESICG